MSHVNSGSCPKCAEILHKYAGINQDLLNWFTALQLERPEAHVSCAGRGRVEQESDFHRGASKAHYGQSSHNVNCAVDLFCLIPDVDLYDKHWFDTILGPRVTALFEWYGALGAVFPERPHVQVAEWKSLVHQGLAKLVE